jgi:hypothetical protein
MYFHIFQFKYPIGVPEHDFCVYEQSYPGACWNPVGYVTSYNLQAFVTDQILENSYCVQKFSNN